MLAQDRSGDIFIHGYRFISSEILYLLYIMKGVAVIFRLPENTDLNTMNKFIRGFMGRIQRPGKQDTDTTGMAYWKIYRTGNS